MKALEGKICLVTGASRGIGSEIARLFAEEGAVVVCPERRSGSVEEWSIGFEYPDRIIPMLADLDSEKDIKTLVMNTKKRFGRIDVLANVAGIEFNEKIGFISESNMQKMFATNVYAVIELIQYAGRVMMRQPEGGSIINISSVVGVKGNPGQLVYSATKGAVISLTKTAAKELAPYRIRVNSVAPGITNTEMICNTSEEFLKKRIERIALGRMAEPRDVAEAVLFLASEKSSYITGQILGVDGGTIM